MVSASRDAASSPFHRVWNRAGSSVASPPVSQSAHALGEGAVPAEQHLLRRREPPQPEPVGSGEDERGLGEVHLGGDRLQPEVVELGLEETDRGRVAPEGLGREDVDAEQRRTHGAAIR